MKSFAWQFVKNISSGDRDIVKFSRTWCLYNTKVEIKSLLSTVQLKKKESDAKREETKKSEEIVYTPVHKRFTILDVLTHAKNVYCIIIERDKNYRSLFNFISLSLERCENIVNFAQCGILKILVNESVDRNT